MDKPKAKLLGENGNIFNLDAIASRALKRAGQEDKAVKMREQIFASKTYDDALRVIGEFVDIE